MTFLLIIMLQTLHPKALLVRVGRVRHPIGVEQEKEEFAGWSLQAEKPG